MHVTWHGRAWHGMAVVEDPAQLPFHFLVGLIIGIAVVVVRERNEKKYKRWCNTN